MRNFYRRLRFTIPRKNPGFFDGNLGTYCICNELCSQHIFVSLLSCRNAHLQKVQKIRDFSQERTLTRYILIFLAKIPGICLCLRWQIPGISLIFEKHLIFNFFKNSRIFFSPFINTSSLHKYIFPFINTSSPFINTSSLHKYIFAFITGGRLPFTIPHKNPGFFAAKNVCGISIGGFSQPFLIKFRDFLDGNLGTYCVSHESAASTSSIPFWAVETRSCKSPKIPGIFARTDSHTLRCDFSFKNSRNLFMSATRNSRDFLGFWKASYF